VLVKITHASDDEIEGVDLSALEVGRIYDVPAELATYLIVTRSAEPAELPAGRERRRHFSGKTLPFPVAADRRRHD